ncbi:hypothetical protein D3C87_2044300 [compost metagenome]
MAQRLSIDEDFPAGRGQQRTGCGEEGAFAGAGWSQYSDKLPFVHRKVKLIQYGHGSVAVAVGLCHLLHH